MVAPAAEGPAALSPAMRLLIIIAHPLPDSYTHAIAAVARDTLTEGGHEVDWLDLYAEQFDPRLTEAERRSYFTGYDRSEIEELCARLEAAQGLVLVFPTWWFGLPAILKGWLDRVFAPGIAFEHAAGGGLDPRLTNIRLIAALTTTGAPWWVIKLMGDPVRRLFRRGIAPMCGKEARFEMLSLHDLDRASNGKRDAHLGRVRKAMAAIRPR